MENSTNLSKLMQDIASNTAAEQEANENNFGEPVVLTDEETERINKLKETTQSAIMVSESSPDRESVVTPIAESIKSLEQMKVLDETDEDTRNYLKMINSGDIVPDISQLKKDARDQAIKAFRQMAPEKSQEITDENYLKINDEAINVLMKHFNLEQFQSDIIVRKMSKMTLSQIIAILPESFVDLYISESEKKSNNISAKQTLLATIAYLGVTGPEMDYLNQYIERENQLMMVSKRLLQCQVDFAKFLKDPKSIQEILDETLKIAPADESVWSKYIKMPNRVHNEFAQRVVIERKYKDAYTQILDEYPVDPENPEVNAKARAMIQAEINECYNKIEAYQKVLDMEDMYELWGNLMDRIKTYKKMNMRAILVDLERAVERIRRGKQDVPFPGYNGEKNTDQILKNFMSTYPVILKRYNEMIDTVREKDATATNIPKISIEGYNDTEVYTVFSIMIVILMGRIMKRFSSNTRTKYDAIMLDCYFQLFCKMGTDIYIMTDIWNMMKDGLVYILEKFYIPNLKGGKA